MAYHRIGLRETSSPIKMESKNYLYPAPSNARLPLGPELRSSQRSTTSLVNRRLSRGGRIIWQAAQATGEQRMCHSVSNLEHHHFKHTEHRRPGDVHIHFFGADMFSFKDRLQLEDDDVMSIAFEGFGRPLRNPIRVDSSPESLVAVKSL